MKTVSIRAVACIRLVRSLRRLSRAWNVDFYRREGVRTIAMLGTESEVMGWAREKAKRDGVKRWASKPHPEFNDRYNGKLEHAACPDWQLVRPNAKADR